MARDLGFDAHHPQQHGRFRRPRFRAGFSLRRQRRHDPPEPAGRGLDSLFQRGVRLAGTGRRRDQRLQPDAAEEEPRFARADPRQVRARDGLPDFADGHHEGPADDLQSRHAGGQGAAVRSRRPVGRVARDGARGGRIARSCNPARPAAAAEESWVVATDLAEALARAGTPFHQAHQIVGRFVLESVRTGKKPADWTRRGDARASRPSSPARWPACSTRQKASNRARSPAAPDPQAVAAALAEARQPAGRDDHMTKTYRQGPDPEADPQQADHHPGRAGAGAEERRASRPRR